MVNLECKEYQPEVAVVFYKENRYGNPRAYAMRHEINRVKGKFSLGAGKAISVRQMEAVFKAMRPEQDSALEIIPDNVLAYNAADQKMIWFQPQIIAEMFVLDEGKTQRIVTCWPAMLFAVKHKKISCFALPKNERPSGETELMRAPFGNVYSSNALCTGNAILPKQSDLNAIGQWNDVFYRTAFSHPNGNHQPIKGVERSSTSRWWLKRNGNKRFPYGRLIKTGATLNDLVHSLAYSDE